MALRVGGRTGGGRGFTLPELVMILVIIGVLAVVALPRFDLLRGYDEIGYRDRVRATLEYARKSAVAQRRSVQVTLAGNGLTVEVQRQTPEGEGTASWAALPLPGSSTNQITAPGTVTLAGPPTLAFDPLGRATATPTAASYSYTVTGDAAATITVEAETGYVH